MDANQAKFHLMLGADDWGRATPGLTEWNRVAAAGLKESPPVVRNIASLAELWKRSSEDAELTGLDWDLDAYELTLAPQVFEFQSTASTAPLSIRDRRGAGRDRYGNWYWISDDEREILVNSSGTGNTTHFWSTAAD